MVLPLLLVTPTIKLSLDHMRCGGKRNRNKWKRSDSSDSDSVEFVTPLTTHFLLLGHKRSYDSDYDSAANATKRQIGKLRSFLSIAEWWNTKTRQ